MAKKTISDWLGFIRPHVNEYLTRSPGERGQYLDEVSKSSGLSNNTLRRFIAASQFLEGEGITSLPSDGKMPVGAVERIARIGKYDPGRVKGLLAQLENGRLTIADLREDLKKVTSVTRSLQDLHGDPDRELARWTREFLVSDGTAESDDIHIASWPDVNRKRRYLFGYGALPRLVTLPGNRLVLVMNEGTVLLNDRRHQSNKPEFLRNILVGLTLFDRVVVYASYWRNDIEELLREVHVGNRERVLFAPIPHT